MEEPATMRLTDTVRLTDTTRHQEEFRLNRVMRRLKKMLEEDTGVRPQPIPQGPPLRYRVKKNCGECNPCKKEECRLGEAGTGRAKDMACLAADRRCVQGKPLPPPFVMQIQCGR